VLLISPRRAHDARLIAALKPLIGAIDVSMMRQANYSVDRQTDKATPVAAAARLNAKIATGTAGAR
jgi:osmoprotectant transport system permease protein